MKGRGEERTTPKQAGRPPKPKGFRHVLAWLGIWIVLGAASLAAAYYYFILLNPGPEISRENIQRIFALESPVYYDDGQSVLGVFFQEEHRTYVPYDRIPRFFVLALLAAEDKNFFSHRGVDPGGILRALALNIKAGRVVQGGSTITQQTAKNLFKRQRRSFYAKLVELVHALKLEAHYSKEQILEWYANQFFVTGNGVGLGIASQYFFNKPPEKLTLVESAFLAGCVKAPNRYNPFIQKGEQARRQALHRAKERTHYVLKGMLELGFIDQKQFQEAIAQEIPFKQGKIRYGLNAILEVVRERLERPEIQEALAEAGVENIATSGIRIYTSIRKELQEETLRAVRQNLSMLETRLSGYKRENILEHYQRVLSSEEEVDRKEFLFGKVKAVRGQAPSVEIDVELPGGEVAKLDREGLQPLLTALVQGMRGTWAAPRKGDEALLLKEIQIGDPIFVRVRGKDKDGRTLLTMERYPELNAGVLVVQDGFIRAMVGGVDNVHFNRAIDARRQVGSVFKPLVYMAALQLGWNNLDPLKNRWQAFPYMGRIYIPRPDHPNVQDWVSMTWAGVKSENIATVWLLYHLCDRLNPSQLKELARILDMAPRSGESRGAYVSRIRDQMGILVTRESLLQAAFEETKEELRTDLIFGGRNEELRGLDDLHYGSGVERYLRERHGRPESKATEEELRVLHHNFLRLRALQEDMRNDYESLRWAVTRADPGVRAGLPAGGKGRFYFQHHPDGERIVYTQNPGGRPLVALDLGWLASQVGMGTELERIIPLSRIWVDGVMPASLLDQLQEGIQKRLASLREKDPYDLEVLIRVPDFRVTMALRYVVHLAKRAGVESPLEPVLSLPLGANAVTMEDVSRLYYAIVSGGVFRGSEEEDSLGSSTFLIRRIEGPDGEVLYESEPRFQRIIPEELCVEMAEILRKVVSHGTGHQAEGALVLKGGRNERLLVRANLKVPALGKTGTANEYQNSSFVGLIPGPVAGSLQLTHEKGVVIAVYVGYDDNRPMKNAHIRVYGAAGALPIWTWVAQSALQYLDYQEQLDLVELAFRPSASLGLQWSKDSVEIPVDGNSGLPRRDGGEGPRIRTYGEIRGEKVELKRFFAPIDRGER